MTREHSQGNREPQGAPDKDDASEHAPVDKIDELLEEVDAREVQEMERRPPSERPVHFVSRDVPLPEGLVEAKVISVAGAHFRARISGKESHGPRTYFVHLARKLLIQKRTLAHPVSVGDDVWLRPVPTEGAEEEQAQLVAVRQRRTQLSRPAVGGRHRGHRHKRRGGATRGKEEMPEQVMVANLDRVLVTVACEPDDEIRINLVDRFLVAAARNDLEAAVIFNKADLLSPARREEYTELLALYRRLGYPALLASAVATPPGGGEGLEALRELLRGRTSVFAGQSGVGKTSLLNALEPDLRLRVAPVNRKTGRGRHTTTTVSLLPLSFGGYIVDTPGIREFGLQDLAADEVDAFYPEIAEASEACAFRNCSHTGREPDCAVIAAVEAGTVDRRRYESYLSLRDSLR